MKKLINENPKLAELKNNPLSEDIESSHLKQLIQELRSERNRLSSQIYKLKELLLELYNDSHNNEDDKDGDENLKKQYKTGALVDLEDEINWIGSLNNELIETINKLKELI